MLIVHVSVLAWGWWDQFSADSIASATAARVGVEAEGLPKGRVVDLTEGDVHGLLVGVEVDGAVPALVPEPRRLDAAKRCPQVAHVVRVQPHHAGLDGLREVVGPREIVGPDVRREAVFDPVRQFEGLGVGVEWRYRHDGSEDLLLKDPRVRSNIGEDGGSHEVAVGEPIRPGTAGHEARLGLADLDVAHDLVVVLGVHEGTDLGCWVVRIADDDPVGLRRVALDELVIHRASTRMRLPRCSARR